MTITSRDNSLLRRARAVRDGKVTESIFIEGLRLCEEALSSELKIEAVIYSQEIARKERAAHLIDELGKVCEKLASVNEKLLASISYTKTPQGIIALALRRVAFLVDAGHLLPGLKQFCICFRALLLRRAAAALGDFERLFQLRDFGLEREGGFLIAGAARLNCLE